MISTSSPRRASRWIAIGVLALALLPALTACGSSSKSSDSATSSTLPDARTKALSGVTVAGEGGSKPTVTFAAAFVGDSEENLVVVPGTGAEVKAGQRVSVNYIAISGNDGKELDSTFGATPQGIILDKNSLLAPVYNALVGQKVGARVLVSANVTETQGTWILFVFDILGTEDVPTSASGTPVTPPAGLPTVTVENGIPTITPPTGNPPTALISQVLIKGNGPVITAGQTVLMQYTGMISRIRRGSRRTDDRFTGAARDPTGQGLRRRRQRPGRHRADRHVDLRRRSPHGQLTEGAQSAA